MKKLIIPIMLIVLLTSCKPYPKTVNDWDTVYYVPKGKSYHSTDKCPSLARSSTILEATLNKLARTPKADPCDNCVKQ